MRKIFIVVLGMLALMISSMPARAGVRLEGGVYVVEGATGRAPVKNGKKAPAREEARRMAYRDALDQALAACVPGLRDTEHYAAAREKVLAKASSLVKGFKASGEAVDENGIMTLTGVCRIGENMMDEVLGPDVIAMLGNPRIMILINELVGDKPPFISTAETEAMRIFEKAGYLIVDPVQARALLHLDPATGIDDEAKLTEAARTLRADIIIVGKAVAGAYAKQKIHGVTLYGVSGTVQLRAILTRTAYQISSKTVSQSTGKTPAQSLGGGAERCFKQAAAQAARQIVYKIAYSLASAGSALDGTTLNIKIADATFREVEAIEKELREMAGASGKLFERSFNDGLLELDLVSNKTAQDVAAFLSERNVAIQSRTAQTLSGQVRRGSPTPPPPAPTPLAAVNVDLKEVQSFDEEKIIEEALQRFIGESGKVESAYDKGAETLKIAISFYDGVKTAREVAAFLNRPELNDLGPEFEALKRRRVKGIEVNGVASNSVSGKLIHTLW